VAPGNPRNPATDAMPTRVPDPRVRIGAMNGWNVFTMPITLMSRISRNTSVSRAWSVRLPMEMPALAITTSGGPWRSTKRAAAAATEEASRTSQG